MNTIQVGPYYVKYRGRLRPTGNLPELKFNPDVDEIKWREQLRHSVWVWKIWSIGTGERVMSEKDYFQQAS